MSLLDEVATIYLFWLSKQIGLPGSAHIFPFLVPKKLKLKRGSQKYVGNSYLIALVSKHSYKALSNKD